MRTTLETTDLAGNRSALLEDTQINKTGGPGSRLCWFPDGRLVYNKWTSELGGELVVVDVDIGSGQLRQGPRRFFGMDGTRPGFPSASADGKRLAFVRGVWDRRLMLLEIGVETRDPELVPVCLTDWTAYPGVWSTDGDRIFFNTERKIDDFDIYMRDLDERREEPFLVTPRSESAQCLTPDGSRLLYLQGQDLMSIPVGGGVSRQVLRLPHDHTEALIRCAVAPDSTCVIVEFDGAELVVTPFSLDGGVDAELLRVEVDLGTDRNVGFDLSPDGSRAVVTEWMGRIRVFDLSTGISRELVNEWEGRPQKVFWSRNGAFLYLSGMMGLARFWIVRMDLEGGYEVLYESEETWAFKPVPSPDDRLVVFHTTRPWADIWMIEGF
jgi:Tol biopolymer transport system component